MRKIKYQRKNINEKISTKKYQRKNINEKIIMKNYKKKLSSKSY